MAGHLILQKRKFKICSIVADAQPPSSEFDCCKSRFNLKFLPSKVSLLKIFARDGNEKVKIIAHNIFPYFYYKYSFNETTKFGTLNDTIKRQILIVGCALESVLGSHSIYQIVPISGKSIYGYFDESEIFLKIVLFNYQDMGKSVSFLRNSSVENKQILFEAHIPYELQFSLDYGIGGIGDELILDWSFLSFSDHHQTFHCWPQGLGNRKKILKNREKCSRPNSIGSFPGNFFDSLDDFVRKIIIPGDSNTEKQNTLESIQSLGTPCSLEGDIPDAFSSIEFYIPDIPTLISDLLEQKPKNEKKFIYSSQDLDQDEVLMSQVKNDAEFFSSQYLLSQDDSLLVDILMNRLYPSSDTENSDNSDTDKSDDDQVIQNFDSKILSSDEEFVPGTPPIEFPVGKQIYYKEETFGIAKNSSSLWYRPLFDPPSIEQSNVPDLFISPDKISVKKNLKKFSEWTVQSMELFIMGEGNLTPNPENDPIMCIVFASLNPSYKIVMKINDGCSGASLFHQNVCFEYYDDEPSLIRAFMNWMNKIDPDILISYHASSTWKYLLERTRLVYKFLNFSISRDIDNTKNHANLGRYLFSVSKLLVEEIEFCSSFEFVYSRLKGETFPRYSKETLRMFYSDPLQQFRCIDYLLLRVVGCFDLLLEYGILERGLEFSKFFKINLDLVFSRGSQFKIESLFMRIAKLESFLPYSPCTINEVPKMAALECIPLVLEPENKYYCNPIIVLDFQSLYPSVIISENYCFSTCLGKFFDGKKIGVKKSPSGSFFVDKNIREGILPKMLSELLNARIEILSQMKNSSERSRLDAFQQGLKLVLNTTFGYTSAGMSGRMPMIEVADSIVEFGRKILERSIKYIESQYRRWGGKVIYGDTDSIFVEIAREENPSLDQIFLIAKEISQEITNLFSSPIKLKIEKIYQPFVICSKKRYMGYRWDNSTQKIPVFGSKGTEASRSDSCLLTSHTIEQGMKVLMQNDNNFWYLEKMLINLFQTLDKEFKDKIHLEYPIEYFQFCKKIRDRDFVPNSHLTCVRKLISRRKFFDPKIYKDDAEKISYIVCLSKSKNESCRLADKAKESFLFDPSTDDIDLDYYVNVQLIPALLRCFPPISNSNFGVDGGIISRLSKFSFKASKLCVVKNSRIENYFSTKSNNLNSQKNLSIQNESKDNIYWNSLSKCKNCKKAHEYPLKCIQTWCSNYWICKSFEF